MLWNAGQERLGRERTVRLAESFTVARDAALEVLVATGQAKPVGSWKQPLYIRASRPPVVRSPATRDTALAKLGRMFPGIVKSGTVQ
jgi:hypothetical protein